MWSSILVTVLTAVPAPQTVEEFPKIAAELQTGSLIFSQGDCLAVKVFSGSSYTHVGIVVRTDDSTWVYDAMNGPGVRKTRLDEYLQFLVPCDVQLAHPQHPLTESERTRLVQHLNSQLGRPYRIRHHVTGKRADGVHCSELVIDALMTARKMQAQNPPRVSPGSLLHGAIESQVYEMGQRYDFVEAKPPVPVEETWCQKSCRQTGECCTAICNQLSRWFLCREKSS